MNGTAEKDDIGLTEQVLGVLRASAASLSSRHIADALGIDDVTGVAAVLYTLTKRGTTLRTGESGHYRYHLMPRLAAGIEKEWRITQESAALPQPEVGQNAGSQPSDRVDILPASAEGPAAAQTTPEAPASGAAKLTIALHSDGSLRIALGATAIDLDQFAVLELGDFLYLTEKFWRP